VALGGFLSHRGVISAWAVFAVTISVNLAGTVTVYYIARRYGRSFLAGRLGRRLLPPAAIIAMEREYLRFGVAGIFLSRLLPGFRSFVAPFTGLVNLSPAKAMAPIAVAASLWYGVLVYAGVRLGEEWDAINRLVSHLNRTLAVVGGIFLVVLIVWLLVRRRRSQQDRLWDFFEDALGKAQSGGADGTAAAGAATVLLEIAQGDEEIPGEDLLAIEARLRNRWNISGQAPSREGQSVDTVSMKDTQELRARIAERFDLASRIEFAVRLRRIAAGEDGELGPHEGRLLRRAAELLGVSTDDLEEASRRATES
jgi:membrane protein DedA with SNARE-associated domain/uncharacterized tellurite resistance protein B-like protein